MENEAVVQVIIRKAVQSDQDFILDSWCKGQYYGSPFWTQIPKQIFHSAYAKHILQLLSNPNTEVDVAVLSMDPNTIIGFVVCSGPILHWAYTKNDYRKQGIIRMLLKGKVITTVTASTLPGASITKKKKFVFNPFILFGE